MTTPTEADRNARVEEIRGRAEKATPGPWKEVENRTHSIIDYPNSGHAYIGGVAQWSHCAKGPDKEQRQANAAFIAHAREDIPYLLAENARQAAELDRLKAERVELAAFAYFSPRVEGVAFSDKSYGLKILEAFDKSRS